MTTWTRGERAFAASLAVLTSAGYLAVAHAHGALGASRNDDWTYYRIAFAAEETGAFVPDPYTWTMLVGQILLARPVMAVWGQQLAPLQILVAVLAAIGLFATYAVVRTFLTRGLALLAVATLALGPIYGALGTTFMSDVPSFAFQALSLWAGLRACTSERRPVPWLVLALALCLMAFSIREYAVAAAVAIALTYGWVRRPSGRELVGLLAALGLWLAAAGALYFWRTHLPLARPPAPLDLVPAWVDFAQPARVVFTTGLLVSPAALLAVRRLGPVMRRRWFVVFPGLSLVVAAWVGLTDQVLTGNYVQIVPSYAVTLFGSAPPIWDPDVWRLVGVAALLATLVLVATLSAPDLWTRSLRPGTPEWRSRASAGEVLALAFGLASVILVVALGLFAQAPILDRYLLGTAPFLCAWLALSPPAPPSPHQQMWNGATLVVMTAFAFFGLRTVETSATLDGAKWQLAEAVEAQGYGAATIDGGLEWFGLHQPGPVVALRSPPSGTPMWHGLFTESTTCVMSRYASERDPSPAPRVVAELDAHAWLGPTFHLVAERTRDPACPSR